MSKKDELIPEDLGTEREKEIGQHIGYRYDVNLVPDYDRLTPFLKKYLEVMQWDDLNWLRMYIWAMRRTDQQYSTGI